MSVFSRAKQRMLGSELKFDNLSNIAKLEEDDDDSNLPTKHQNDLSIFTKENYREPRSKNLFKKSAPVAPACVPEAEEKSLAEESEKSEETAPEFLSVAENAQTQARDETKSDDGEDTTSTITGTQSYAETIESPIHEDTKRSEDDMLPTLPVSARGSRDDRFETSRSTSIMTDGPSVNKRGIDIRAAPSIDSVQEDDDTHADDYTDIIFSKVRHNRADYVLDALQDDFDVNTRDQYGNTIFHICAQNNHKRLASTILKNFPDSYISRQNKKGMTPLDYAEKYGFTAMAAWLRSKGAREGGNWNTNR